ncbi:MAG TPA: ATP-binding SpoIIE family protein phosphatase [Mycobacteriales bacterium]|nr:ATP-binding SpoIIE family protein phosphatase [Mycobacteriales bacterium]
MSAYDSEVGRLRSQVAALEQLLEVFETAALQEVVRRDELVAELASRYEREHQIAETLQRSLLPASIPSPAGLEIATRYSPGAAGAKVGGDWYDAIPLSHGRVGVVLGDVVGHGVRAASTMGQLRAALRAYAVFDATPGSVLRRLETLVSAVGDAAEGYVATLVYAVVDPARGEMRYLSAGHPAPLILRPDGSAMYLDGGRTLPLGLGGARPPEPGSVDLEVGSTVLFYSDGLIERRGESLDEGLDRLQQACLGHREDVEELCDHVLTAMSRSGPSGDDVAVLAVRATGRRAECVFDLPAVTSSVPTGRHEVVETLHRIGLHRLVDAASVVASELLTNAVKHASASVRLTMTVEQTGDVRLAVDDDDPRAPDLSATQMPPLEAEGGRGLPIVDALCEEWGVELTPHGKSVWCVLSLVDELD